MNKHKSSKSINRNFGLLIACVCWAYSIYLISVYGFSYGAFWLVLAGFVFSLMAIVASELLDPLCKAWIKIGDLIGLFVSPIVLGIIFFVLITPIAVLGRFFGRDELRIARHVSTTYWLDRDVDVSGGDSFKNQF